MSSNSGALCVDVDFDFRSSYHSDVLCLADDDAENGWDGRLMAEAKELGVKIASSPPLKPISTYTSSSVPTRRSISAYSIASQSTGLTSNFSDLAKEPHYPTNTKRLSRTSLSLRDYDIFLARGTTDSRRTSISFSRPTTPAHSTFSLPLSSPAPTPKRQSRVLKGLSILKLHRTDSTGAAFNSCPHCPNDASSQRRAVHNVPCGHRLCTQAMRSTLKSALASAGGAVPSCCGVPIPGGLLQQIATSEEEAAFLRKLEQWDEAISLTPSMFNELDELAQSERPSTGDRKQSIESKVDSVGPDGNTDLKEVQDRQDYKQLQEQQADLRDRFLAWVSQRRTDLQTRHESIRADMSAHHENAEDDLMERHGQSMAEAEDRQVKAEADLRESQAQEKRDHATALKHMEAYCAGIYSTGETHNRAVTDQSRAELEKARNVRDSMDSKHASAISVLRGDQARRIRMRQQRQDKELQELLRAQRKEELEVDRSCSAATREFDEFVAEKQGKISARWNLENAIFARKVEIEIGRVLSWSIPGIAWPVHALDSTKRPVDEMR